MVHEVPVYILDIQLQKQVEVGQQIHIHNLRFIVIFTFSTPSSVPSAGISFWNNLRTKQQV